MISPIVEKSLSWQDLCPELNADLSTRSVIHFFTLQTRCAGALRHFLADPQSEVLVLKTDDVATYSPLLEDFVRENIPQNEKILGAHYEISQGDSFSFPHITVAPAQSLADNFAAQKRVASALYVDAFKLFGALRIHPHSKDIQLQAGLVHQLNGGVLILSVAALLQQFDLWWRLKQILRSKQFDWYSAHPFKDLPCDIPSYPLSLKVILLGNREDLATFAELETELYPWAAYSEVENYYWINELAQQQNWVNYVHGLTQQQQIPPLTAEAINKLYQILVRDSENRQLISIAPQKISLLLQGSAAYAGQIEQLDAAHIEAFYQQQLEQQGYLQQQTYADILNEQVYVATDGKMIGQINGLSVIEYHGTPVVFGEPSRMSCLVQFGEGEIIDIDRKNELAGNIHSKGMMIAQSCLANILALPSQLPFSASLVFEQSYGEIDGDSASLASFCVLVSALAELALPQSIAVTGSIDQFGLVHSVGGVNEKIEGFFTICQQRGLTGKQGVIIPSTVISQLSLQQRVVDAVKNGEFFIYPVEDVYQACEILFQRDLMEEDEKNYNEDNQPIAHLIAKRIERSEQHNQKRHWLDFLFKK